MLISNTRYLLKILLFLETTFFFFFRRIFNVYTHCLKIIPGYIFIIKISNKYIYPLFFFLRYHCLCLFKSLIDIACADYIGSKPRFTLSYNLLSFKFNVRLLVKVNVSNLSKIISCGSLFNSAKWVEREIYEFYGIGFYTHRDLRHLLLDYGFKGFPLRKDFPLSGYVEVVYNDSLKKINYRELELVQEYRKNYLRKYLI